VASRIRVILPRSRIRGDSSLPARSNNAKLIRVIMWTSQVDLRFPARRLSGRSDRRDLYRLRLALAQADSPNRARSWASPTPVSQIGRSARAVHSPGAGRRCLVPPMAGTAAGRGRERGKASPRTPGCDPPCGTTRNRRRPSVGYLAARPNRGRFERLSPSCTPL
jgi:hypothetical protein